MRPDGCSILSVRDQRLSGGNRSTPCQERFIQQNPEIRRIRDNLKQVYYAEKGFSVRFMPECGAGEGRTCRRLSGKVSHFWEHRLGEVTVRCWRKRNSRPFRRPWWLWPERGTGSEIQGALFRETAFLIAAGHLGLHCRWGNRGPVSVLRRSHASPAQQGYRPSLFLCSVQRSQSTVRAALWCGMAIQWQICFGRLMTSAGSACRL